MRKTEDLFYIIIAIAFILSIPFMIGWSYKTFGKTYPAEICVKSKDIHIMNSQNGTKREKVVFAKDDVYSVNDSMWVGHYNSYTTYNKLEPGHCYAILYNGQRIGSMNMKRNIISVVKELDGEE
jgi:hypothetical protein